MYDSTDRAKESDSIIEALCVIDEAVHEFACTFLWQFCLVYLPTRSRYCLINLTKNHLASDRASSKVCVVLLQPQRAVKGAAWGYWTPRRDIKGEILCYLIVNLFGCTWESDVLFEVVANLHELLALLPIIKGTSDIHIGGWVLPNQYMLACCT